MTGMQARVATSATVSLVVTRACARCGHKREPDRPCEGCGNPEPPTVHDLGVQSRYDADPAKRDWWEREGARLAEQEVQRAFADRLDREG